MMNVKICSVNLKNPVIAASGTFGFGGEYSQYFDVARLGGISSKGLTIAPKQGNDGERMHEVRGGMMNSVGLQNPGIEEFIKSELSGMRDTGAVVIANLGGSTIEDYVKGASMIDAEDVDIIELNISCPNVKEGGMAFGIKASVANEVVKQVRQVVKKPLMVKLSPNAHDIVEMACACEQAGADAISLINTFKGMAIDIRRRKPVFGNMFAGVSGPAIKPMALRMVYEVCQNVDIPVVGMGGIASAEDAIEFIMAGAHAIQVGTANFIKPDICIDIIDGMESFMRSEGIKSIEEIRGII